MVFGFGWARQCCSLASSGEGGRECERCNLKYSHFDEFAMMKVILCYRKAAGYSTSPDHYCSNSYRQHKDNMEWATKPFSPECFTFVFHSQSINYWPHSKRLWLFFYRKVLGRWMSWQDIPDIWMTPPRSQLQLTDAIITVKKKHINGLFISLLAHW